MQLIKTWHHKTSLDLHSHTVWADVEVLDMCTLWIFPPLEYTRHNGSPGGELSVWDDGDRVCASAGVKCWNERPNKGFAVQRWPFNVSGKTGPSEWVTEDGGGEHLWGKTKINKRSFSREDGGAEPAGPIPDLMIYGSKPRWNGEERAKKKKNLLFIKSGIEIDI